MVPSRPKFFWCRILFCENSTFLGKNSISFQNNSLFLTTKKTSGIRFLHCSMLAVNLNNDNGVINFQHGVIINFFTVTVFFFSNLGSVLRAMLTSLLVLQLGQLLFIRDLSKNRELWKDPRLDFVQYLGPGTSYWY